MSRYYGKLPARLTKSAVAKASSLGSAGSSAAEAERGLMILSRAQMTLHDVQVRHRSVCISLAVFQCSSKSSMDNFSERICDFSPYECSSTFSSVGDDASNAAPVGPLILGACSKWEWRIFVFCCTQLNACKIWAKQQQKDIKNLCLNDNKIIMNI